MIIRIGVVTGYLLLLLGIGLVARQRAKRGLEDYFLASRSLSPLVLFLTMAATNFSAFTVFGFSGAGWRMGYAFYPVMAFGTGFMALTFVLIGEPIRRLGEQHGIITPSEAVYKLSRSRGLQLLFLGVMALFTLPYLAMQPMAAGYALETLLGIPYFAGAALMTCVMLLYTYLGGFRGVAWTDVLQGGMLITLLVVALMYIAGPFGGLASANLAASEAIPELFARPGLGGAMSPGIWFGYMLLWFLCDPMFPQLFQRFYAARDAVALRRTMVLYPLLTGFLFLLPVSIGVIGRLAFAELPAGAASDQILPLLLSQYAPAWIEALVLVAALAALMSTLDSQLLTLSSMVTRDVIEPGIEGYYMKRHATWGRDQTPRWIGKAVVTILALAGLGIAWNPPASFLEIATETFTGLAVLFPTVVALLYWRRVTAAGAIASILVGEGLVLAYHFDWLPTFGTLPVIPVVGATIVILVLVSLLSKRTGPQPSPVRLFQRRWKAWAWTAAFVALFIAANDFWDWGNARLGWLGYPRWLWWSAGLCVLASVAFCVFGRQAGSRSSR